MIKQRKATATQPTQWSISFALSLSELGDMQGTVTLNGTNVNVKINTENQEAIDTLNQYEEEMHTLLEQLGLNLGGFNLQLGLENNNIQTENLHLLDIRI
jgi:flagellar hook-length control protein FliK